MEDMQKEANANTIRLKNQMKSGQSESQKAIDNIRADFRKCEATMLNQLNNTIERQNKIKTETEALKTVTSYSSSNTSAVKLAGYQVST